MMKKYVVLYIVMICMLEANDSKRTLPVSHVEVALVKQASLSTVQRFNGSVKFHEQSRIAALSSGVVTQLFFNEADVVKKGDLLLSIDDEVLQATVKAQESQLEEAKLKVDLAKLEYERNQKLLASKGISKQVYEKFYYAKLQMEQNYEALKQSLKAQKVTLAKKQLYAPFDGIIASKEIQKGEWLNAGATVALLLNPKDIDVLFYLPQELISKVQKGMTFQVSVNSKLYEADVLGLLLNGDESTRTFGLLLRLHHNNQTQLFQGMQAQLLLKQNSLASSYVVPRDAIIQKYDTNMVYIIQEGVAVPVIVSVESFQADEVSVISDKLKVGMQVIIKGNERLRPNAQVKIRD